MSSRLAGRASRNEADEVLRRDSDGVGHSYMAKFAPADETVNGRLGYTEPRGDLANAQHGSDAFLLSANARDHGRTKILPKRRCGLDRSRPVLVSVR